MRILVVEDDSETAAYITQGFAEEGHVVETLGDGRDGLSQAMGETYDIIVVDRMLPGSGWPFAGTRVARRRPEGAGHLPYIARRCR